MLEGDAHATSQKIIGISERDVAFDLLRALVMIEALVLHVDYVADLGRLARPFVFVQFSVFTVGGIFFFTAGAMARRIYVPRFATAPAATALRVVRKGLILGGVYLAYVAVMHLLTGTTWPSTPVAFLLDHPFFAKVLIPFTLLYLLTPIALLVHRLHPVAAAAAVLVVTALILVYDPTWPLPERLRGLLLDKQIFFYPLLPALITWTGGFVATSAEERWPKLRRPPMGIFLFCLVLLLTHVFFARFIQAYTVIAVAYRWRCWFDAILPLAAVVCLRFSLGSKRLRRICESPPIAAIGVLSLHFFVLVNGLLCLAPIDRDASRPAKLLVLVGVGLLGWAVTLGWYLVRGQGEGIRTDTPAGSESTMTSLLPPPANP